MTEVQQRIVDAVWSEAQRTLANTLGRAKGQVTNVVLEDGWSTPFEWYARVEWTNPGTTLETATDDLCYTVRTNEQNEIVNVSGPGSNVGEVLA